MDKFELRKRMRALRESLPEGERKRIDAEVAHRTCALDELVGADALFTYLSAGTEVDTRALIEWAWSQGKRVAIPRCVPGGNEMTWHWIDTFDGLVRSAFGIDEPQAGVNVAQFPEAGEDGGCAACAAVAIVPGFSFDREGYRLGYGGGFYDVFLPQFAGTSIGLCRSCQMSDEPVPRDAHDIPVDIVVTEFATIRR